jgi:hypothetical protein
VSNKAWVAGLIAECRWGTGEWRNLVKTTRRDTPTKLHGNFPTVLLLGIHPPHEFDGVLQYVKSSGLFLKLVEPEAKVQHGEFSRIASSSLSQHLVLK